MSRVVYRLRQLFPAELAGLVVVMMGITFIPVAITNFAGSGAAGDLTALYVGGDNARGDGGDQRLGEGRGAPVFGARRHGGRLSGGVRDGDSRRRAVGAARRGSP